MKLSKDEDKKLWRSYSEAESKIFKKESCAEMVFRLWAFGLGGVLHWGSKVKLILHVISDKAFRDAERLHQGQQWVAQ